MRPAPRSAIALLGFAALALATAAAAQIPAGKPIRFLVGFPPGGGSDLTARLVGARLAERLGQPVVVENRVGAGGNIAIDAVAKAPPDGLVIGVTGSALTINVTMQPSLPFDAVRDLAPVSKLVNNPLVLAANPSFAPKDLREVIAEAKKQGRTLNYGSPGNGTAMHLMGELISREAGVKLVHVSYKGNGPMVNDLLGGQIPLAIADLASTSGHLKAGKLRAIGIGGPKRTPLAPDIPTLAESGLPGFSVLSWTAVIAPAKTPAAVVQSYSAHIRAILESPDIRERLAGAGLEPEPTTPEELAGIIRAEIANWAAVIKASGIKTE